MKRRLLGVVLASLFGSGLVLTCSSCASLYTPAHALPSKPVHGSATRWEQVSYGRDARFAVCVEPSCPRVTPKTVAPSSPSVAAAAPGTVALQVVDRPKEKVPVRRAPLAEPLPVASNVVIQFPLGSAHLTEDGRNMIRSSLESAKAADRIVVSGRTDALGGDKVNESLALARALAVRNYYRDLVPDLPATFAIDAKGRCCFIATNDDEPGRSKNRRVEVHFSLGGGA